LKKVDVVNFDFRWVSDVRDNLSHGQGWENSLL
jgi:hypothetical protein